MQSETTFTLTFQGEQINVRYRPEYFQGYGHFEFSSPHDPARPIAISNTGYRSHFTPMCIIEAEAAPETCASKILSALMEELSPSNPNQLILF